MTLHYFQDSQASLPSVGMKVVTHVPRASAIFPAPDTDTIIWNGLRPGTPKSRCVEMFCDHAALLSVCLSNMVTCAHWADPMFSCLTDTRDHRLCCSAQVPNTYQDQSLRIFSPLFSLMQCYQICITIV